MKTIRLWLFPIGLLAVWILATAWTIAGAPL